MIVVYISSPYTVGDRMENVDRQMYYSAMLIEYGFCPIAPLLSHFQNEKYPQEYDKWLEIDFELVKRSDVVLRLSGESHGADAEVKCAIDNDIPVVYSVKELIEEMS